MNSVLCLENVSLYGGARLLVHDLNLTVQVGERWVVLGPNGAGKSTLLAAIAGLRAPAQGRVLLQGRALKTMTPVELAQRRAFMADRWSDAFSATVLDTVLTARYCWGGAEAQDLAQAQHWLTALDAQALALRDVRTLSRGERQRVALATALAQDAPLVLLDEPTAHQDPRHQALVVKTLSQSALATRTFVATVHDMNAAAALATHVLMLSGCGPWHAGPVSEVLTAERLSEVFAVPVLSIPCQGTQFFALAP